MTDATPHSADNEADRLFPLGLPARGAGRATALKRVIQSPVFATLATGDATAVRALYDEALTPASLIVGRVGHGKAR
jgi:hypothetical protein